MIKITKNGQDREGWNIVHLRPTAAAYGEWKLFETRSLSRTLPRRIEPFACDAAFFAENLGIHWSGVTHIYSLSERPLDVYRILGLLVPKL
jgi:hypothetical protein